MLALEAYTRINLTPATPYYHVSKEIYFIKYLIKKYIFKLKKILKYLAKYEVTILYNKKFLI